MSFVSISNIVKKFGAGQAKVTALRGLGFSLQQSEFVAVMGPSGSGKSTLLAVMGALTTPDAGEYLVDEIDVYSLSADQRADFRREYLGFVFQQFHLLPYLTLAENAMLPLAAKKIGRQAKRTMAWEALAKVGLSGLENRLPSQVSGGEQERAAIARALVNRPPILLADEPTGNLDQATGREIMELFKALSRDGATIVMVTHSPGFALYADRILEMTDGRLVNDNGGSPVSSRLAGSEVQEGNAWRV